MRNLDNSGRFFVQSSSDGNDDFVNRQKSVFEKLDAVADNTEKNVEEQTKARPSRHLLIENKSHRKQKHEMRQFRGQESIFKRPEPPPPSRFKRNIPDFKRNPQKWTKYTLSDVSPDDMSERSNTAAAMTFLRELKAKKDSESMVMDSELNKITFKKPTNFKKRGAQVDSSDKSESPSFRSSKIIMPEYVVGAKKIPRKSAAKQIIKEDDNHKEIKLDHLNDDDDDEGLICG